MHNRVDIEYSKRSNVVGLKVQTLIEIVTLNQRFAKPTPHVKPLTS